MQSSLNSKKQPLELKGYGGELSLVIHENMPFSQLEIELRQLLQRSGTRQFLKEAPLLLSSPGRLISENDFQRLQTIVQEESGSELVKEMPAKPKTSAKVISVFTKRPPLPEETTLSEEPVVEKTLSPAELLQQEGWKAEDSVCVFQTLRSGQKIESSKTVVLVGDVNAGAEVISSQDILVLGTVRGMVHAGSEGDHDAKIIANHLQPTQIRIADQLTRPPASVASNRKQQSHLEIAFLEGDEIVIDSYQKVRV